MNSVCVICGAAFEGHGLRKTCSESCKAERNRNHGKAWAAANKDKVRLQQAASRSKRIDKAREYDRKRSRTPAGYVDRILERVKKRTPDTDIDRDFLTATLTGTCSLSGVSYQWEKFSSTSFTNPYAPSLDRIDSSKGYYKNNVQWVLSLLNFAKNEMTMKDFSKAMLLLIESKEFMEALMKYE